uniref:ABC transmembrane type-1 domain-containing protein n=1 Tax=Romanomermis culicivorax TaxID=13658 RepID=A0A915KA28_ROMCU
MDDKKEENERKHDQKMKTTTSQDFLVVMESKGNESDSPMKICKATVKRNDSTYTSVFPITSINNRDYFTIFTSLSVLLTLLSLIKSIFFRLMINNAALNLHGRMLESVLYAPLTFFTGNPVGRIINRFSKDTGVMDEQLTLSTYNFLSSCFTCLGILVTLVILNRLILIITIPLLGAFLYLRWFFMKSSRSIRRLKAS